MCRAPPKPSPTPSPQPIICVYCGNSEHRSVECKNRPQDNREEGRISSPVSSGYSRDRQWKPATASSGNSYKTNARSKNSEKAGTTSDKPRIPETGRQHRQPPQRPTQGKPNNKNNFPYRDYRYSDQPRQTRFDEEQNQRYSPHHFAPSHVVDPPEEKRKSHPMQLRPRTANAVEINLIDFSDSGDVNIISTKL